MKTSQQMTREEIIEKLQGIGRWFKGLEIEFIVLGGSVAKNTNQWWSDVDIFISIPNIDNFSNNEMIEFYEKVNYLTLKNSGLDNIEITVIQKVPIKVKFSIIKNGMLLYEYVDGTYTNFKYNTMKEYFDYKIWIDNYYKQVTKNYD